MTLIDHPNPGPSRRMTIPEQFRAVYTVLVEHHPELATSYASHYPEYTTPLARERVLTELTEQMEQTASDPKPIIEAHNEFSRQLVEVIKGLVEEQRDSYKDHIKGQRDLFERSDLTSMSAHKETIKRLEEENARLRKKGRPWAAAAIVSWVVLFLAIGAYLFATDLWRSKILF